MIYHREIDVREKLSYLWTEDQIAPFNELIISFNAKRPLKGFYKISVSLNGSDWMPYVWWGALEQRSFSAKVDSIVLDQDIIETNDKCAEFKILLEGMEGADLSQFHALHVSTNKTFSTHLPSEEKSILLNVEGISQLALDSVYAKRICAATSTTAVIRYLTGISVDPISFSMQVYDKSFDVFGNWVFNVASAYEQLGSEWRCWVQRLENFGNLLEQLYKKIPVVVSVKGRLPGCYLPYDNGHLIAIIGYDAETNEVICMDPAYPVDARTLVRYPIQDFLEAWSRRQGLAFIFSLKH